MTVSSADVRNKQFSLGRKGYRESEVDEFLDAVIEAIDERDVLIESLRSTASTEVSQPGSQSRPDDTTEVGPSPTETVTRLLSLAERTAERYVADARTTAEETVREAERRAEQIIGAAETKAAGMLAEGEAEHRRVLGDLRYEQHRLDDAVRELKAARSHARADLEEYLTALLVKLQESSIGEGQEPSIGPSAIRSLSA